MSKLPFMRMFVGDYMADTSHLSTEEHGAYHLLLYSYWTHRCGPKIDEKTLRKITKLSAHKWKNISPTIMEFFEIRDGRLYQSRIEEELEKAKSKSQQARDAVNSRRDRQPTDVGTSVIQSQSHSHNHKKNKDSSSNLQRGFPDYPSDSLPYKIANYLWQKIKKNNPKAKKPNLQKWSAAADRMLRLDNREQGDIKKLIDWSQADMFWKTVILSPVKLRDKFDQLLVKVAADPSVDHCKYCQSYLCKGCQFNEFE